MKFLGLDFESRLEFKKWLLYTCLPIPAVIILNYAPSAWSLPSVIFSVILVVISGLNNLCAKNPENYLSSPVAAGTVAILTEIALTARIDDLIGLLIIGLVTVYVNRSAYWTHLAIEDYVSGKVKNG